MPETSPEITVIVPVHRDAPAFPRCLAAIRRADPPPAEVVVVCDGEAPEAARLAAEQGCRVIEVPGPRGPARARNAGARAASHPILFFVDSDVELSRPVLAQIAEHFERDPGLTAVFGSYDAAPSDPAFLSQYRNLLHHHVHQTSDANASTFWSACGAVRRDAFLAASGFDERYEVPSIEDIELGYRLTGSGGRIRLDRTLMVRHMKGWRLGALLRTDVFRRALPWGDLILSRRRVVRDLNLRPSSQASVIAVAGLVAAGLGAAWFPGTLMICLLAMTTLVLLNRSFYCFLLQERGAWFTARAIPCHWLFYACGGFGFGLALLRRLALPIRPQ